VSGRLQNQYIKISSFLYISKEQNEKEIRKIISLKVAIKIKYRGMN
jgi:hypothetical protein